ncbi:sulfatase-like hydrolase/transferase [Saccharicrinis fermentans]|nr:sulfatase-like hydrolase/transferase [Saccharicrinis fermentans]
MSKLIFVAGFMACLLMMLSCQPDDTKTKKQPNVIVLLVDDAGYADFGFAGSKDLKTPNIDKLANNGMVFTDAHVSASVCGPSRAGIMTGRYQQRFGFECNPSSDHSGVDLGETTIGEAMQQAGYTTAAFGKWHLGYEPEYNPNARGFDYSWGFLSGGRRYFSNKTQDQPGHTHSIRENGQFTTFEGYLTDRLGDKAVEFIDKNKKDPFFMYWAPNAVHTPMEATEEDMALFKGHPRQKLAAMTWALDRSVGKIVQKLKDEDLLNNTLIFFLSDNGGAHNNQSSNYPLKGFKGNKYEGGHRVAFFMHWPEEIEKGTYNGLTSSLDIFATSIAVTGKQVHTNKTLDGVNLIPYVKNGIAESPHKQLFWRKDQMAAMRSGQYKMIRVARLGYRLYDLEEDLGESNDLCEAKNTALHELQNQLQSWEKGLIQPLWTEGAIWDTITWMIHEDYYLNRPVRVKDPGSLKEWRKRKRESAKDMLLLQDISRL